MKKKRKQSISQEGKSSKKTKLSNVLESPEFLALNSPVELPEGFTDDFAERDQYSLGARILFSRSFDISAVPAIVEELNVIHATWNAWQQRDVEALDNCLASACEEMLLKSLTDCHKYCRALAFISLKLPEALVLPKTYLVLLELLNLGTTKSTWGMLNFLPIFASKLLYRGYATATEWPIELIQSYIGDIIGPNAWTQNVNCKDLVDVLNDAFRFGKEIQRRQYSSNEMQNKVEGEYFAALGKVLKKERTNDTTKSILKLLLVGTDCGDARLIASSFLEYWINDPEYMHDAKRLLDSIVLKVRSTIQSDISTVGNLFLLKVPNHEVIYREMVTQLCLNRKEFYFVGLKALVLAGMNGTDMQILFNLYTVLRFARAFSCPEQDLAVILQEFAAIEETRVKLKSFAWRLEQIGDGLHIMQVAGYLLQPWKSVYTQEESTKTAWLTEIADLVIILLVHSVRHIAKDEISMSLLSLPGTFSFSDVKLENEYFQSHQEKVPCLEHLSLELANFQLEALAWCTDILPVFSQSINRCTFITILKQFLFLEEYKAQFSGFNSFKELTCNALHVLGSCTGASEEILARLILIGINDAYPLSMIDALSIIESLVWRAATFHGHFQGNLNVKSFQISTGLIKLASFCAPEIPIDYFSHIVFKDRYWNACLVLLIIAVYNPSTIGLSLWKKNFNVRCMMELIITENWKKCSSIDEHAGQSVAKFTASELSQYEEKAEETISSILLTRNNVQVEFRGNVTLLEGINKSWQLPKSIIKDLEEANKIFNFGCELRKSRFPDFFAEITNSQSLDTSWQWFKNILPHESDLIYVIPVIWQCELLFLHEKFLGCKHHSFPDISKLYFILSNIILDKAKANDAKIVMEFFGSKLPDKSNVIRSVARHCLGSLFNIVLALSERTSHGESTQEMFFGIFKAFYSNSGCCVNDCDLSWMEKLRVLPNGDVHFNSLLPFVQNAVQVESSVVVISSYLKFLKTNSPMLHAFPVSWGISNAPAKCKYLMTLFSKKNSDQSCLRDLILERFGIEVAMLTFETDDDAEEGKACLLQGYGLCSPKAVLQHYQYLGAAPAAAESVLSLVNEICDNRIEEAMHLVRNGSHHAWMSVSLLQTLLKFSMRDFQNISCIFSKLHLFISSSEKLCVTVKPVPEQANMLSSGKGNMVVSSSIRDCVVDFGMLEVSGDLGLSVGASDTIIDFLELRKCIQREFLWNAEFRFIQKLEAVIQEVKKLENEALLFYFLRYISFPSLALVSRLMFGAEANILNKKYLSQCQTACRQVISLIEIEVARDRSKSLISEGDASIPNDVLCLKFMLAELCSLFTNSYRKCPFRIEHCKHMESHLEVDVNKLKTGDVEGLVMNFFIETFQKLWQKEFIGSVKDLAFKFLSLILQITEKECELLKQAKEIHVTRGVNKKGISLAALSGLFVAYLNLLDQELGCIVHSYKEFQENVEIGVLQKTFGNCLCRLLFEVLVHERSSAVIVNAIMILLWNYFRTHASSCNNAVAEQVESLNTFLLLEVFGATNTDTEFILDILASSTYAWQTGNLCGIKDHISNQCAGKTLLSHLITCLIASYLYCIASKVAVSVDDAEIYDHMFQRPFAFGGAYMEIPKAVNLLLALGLQPVNIFQAAINKIASYDFDWIYNILPVSLSKMEGDGLFQEALNELLSILYKWFPLSFPVHVLMENKMFLRSSCGILQSSYIFDIPGQSFRFHRLLDNAIRITCEGTAENSEFAYGFCHYIARRHPMLLMSHVTIMAVRLKEILADVEKGVHPSDFLGNSLFLVSELLNALRQHIRDGFENAEYPCQMMSFSNTETDACVIKGRPISQHGSQNVRNGLEIIYVVFFSFLTRLNTANLSQYLKVIMSFIHFACHCAAAGNELADVVLKHQSSIKSIADKFPSIKKLRVLVSLIKKGTSHAESIVSTSNDVEESHISEEFSDESPPFPTELILDICQRLQQILSENRDICKDPVSVDVNRSALCYKKNEVADVNELLRILNDVERASTRFPSILVSLEETLIELLKLPNFEVQTVVFGMLNRLLSSCPSDDRSEKIIKALLYNLKSSDCSTATLAAQEALKFYHHCPDLQEELLVELFLRKELTEETLSKLLHSLMYMTR